jgi:serine protease AprX
MDRRRLRVAPALCAVTAAILVAPPAAGAAERRQAPQRFLERGLDLSLARGIPDLVRVRIAMVANPVGRAATQPQLRGHLSRADQLLLRRDPSAGPLLARRHEAARAAAIDGLQSSARAATNAQRALWRAITAMDGRVVESDPITNTLVAVVPRVSLRALEARADVRGVELAAMPTPLTATGLGLSTAAVGAPTWWGAGFMGGTGASDTSPVDLAILQDKIQQDHPAFAGIRFQTPLGRGAPGTDHGTGVASMAISRGASGCGKCVTDDAQRKGVVPGLDSVLDADTSGASSTVWALGIDQSSANGTELPGAADPAEVMSNSGGLVPPADDNIALQSTDGYVSEFGATIAFPAGNTGASGSVMDPCIAYNALCVGAHDYWGTTDPADDRIASFSSRGPSPGGRKKPDLVAVGITMYADADWADSTKGLWTGATTGTSFAAPQAAGAAALLGGSGISDPKVQKAILLNSARLGRSAPDQPMGTQTGWQPDWGWGALDLETALNQRLNFVAADVPGASARFYRASAVAAGDRATLVWHRRANGCWTPGCYPSAMTLTNLDLQQLDPATGAVQAQSDSTIDNVEQVRSPSPAATAVYKVRATSTVDGSAGEPFALAGTRQLTPLGTPQPAVTIDVDSQARRPGDCVTVTATLRNPSPDLTAENTSVTLDVPAGVALLDGAPARSLGTLTTSSPAQTFTWTVAGTTAGLKRLTVRAQATRYGETFAGTATDTLTVDGSGPATTVASPDGTTATRSLGIAWAATDDHSAISHYDVEAAVDGGPWSPWITATTLTQATYHATAGHRYRFRVRATDTLSNTAAWVESAEVTVADSSPPTTDPNPATGNPITITPLPQKAVPRLMLASAKKTRAGVLVLGSANRDATGGVTVSYTTRAARRIYRARLFVAFRAGRFRAALDLPAAARRQRRGTVEIAYRGDWRFTKRTIRRSIALR